MAKRGYDHKKWGIVSNYAGEVRFYDKKRYSVEYDPSGEAHFSKRVSKRSKARSVVKDISFYRNGLLVLILLVTIVRFIFMRDFGYEDAFFKLYPDAVDVYGNSINLYYFDIFGWFKQFGIGVNRYKYAFTSVFSSLNDAFSDNIIVNFINGFGFVVNFLFAIIKTVFLIPFSVVGLLFGGPFAEWIGEGGWVYNFLGWSFPYVSIAEWPVPDANDTWSWLWYWLWNYPQPY